MMKTFFLTFILRSGLHRNENPLNPNLILDLVNNFKTTFKELFALHQHPGSSSRILMDP